MVEVDAAQGVVRPDLDFLLEHDGPVSSPLSGQKMLRPVRSAPKMIGQLMELGPLCMGRREGWYWMVPSFGTLSASSGTNAVT